MSATDTDLVPARPAAGERPAPLGGEPILAEVADEPRCRAPWRRIVRFVFNALRNGCTAAVILCAGVSLKYDRARMVSNSMGPALDGAEDEGDWVLVNRRAYRARRPERGDLVRFRSFDGIPVIKRVVGLPGETVQIVDGRAVIDGRLVSDPPVFGELRYENSGILRSGNRKVQVRAGWYFVLGDNTRDSYDSRYYGAIQAKQILGRADFIYWPPRRIGPVR